MPAALLALALATTAPTDLERLAAVQACTDLSTDYAAAVDGNDPEALAALFTENAVWRPGRTTNTGRVAIRDYLARYVSTKKTGSRHVITNLRITVEDAGRATGTSLVQIYHYDPAKPPQGAFGPRTLGTFRDECVRTPQGWRLQRRELDGVTATP